MKSRIDTSLDHDDVIDLLPWFANGTLEASERVMVSSHVDSCEECRRELQFLTSLNDSVQEDARMSVNEHADVERSLAGVLDRIDATDQQKSPSGASLSSIPRKVLAYLDSIAVFPGLKWAGAALACGLVVALGLQFNANRTTDDYTVLSSPSDDNAAMRLTVHFLPGTEDHEAQLIVDSVLRRSGEEENAIIDASDGTIFIGISRAMQAEALSRLMSDLENDSLIERVEFGPVPQP